MVRTTPSGWTPTIRYPKDLQIHGHAIEVDCIAEAANEWSPSPGKVVQYSEPSGAWVRVDSGVLEEDEVSVYYDPMIAKLIVWGE